MRAIGLVLVAAACGGKEEKKPPEQVQPPVVVARADAGGEQAPPPAPAAKGGYAEDPAAARWLVVVGHTATEPRARYAAIHLGDAAPAVTLLGEASAMPWREWDGHFRTVAAHQGATWAHATSTGGEAPRFAVEVGSAEAPKGRSRVIDLGEREPTALHLAGDVLYVGAGQEVGWVDLASKTPAFAPLVQRDLRGQKAYDLFVRLGDRLLAVDDIVRPMMADWFALDAGGRATRLGDWSLPGVINGHYAHAALRARGADAFTVYLVAPYGIMSGNGHDLAAVPIEGDKLVFEDGLVLQNGRGGATPVLEEHVDRGSGAVESLVAGKSFTEWTGMALDPQGTRLLLAAGARGLLVLPVDFTSDTRAEAVAVGGDCRDVVQRGGRLFALVGKGKATELVVIEDRGGTLAVASRHELPEAYFQFLD